MESLSQIRDRAAAEIFDKAFNTPENAEMMRQAFQAVSLQDPRWSNGTLLVNSGNLQAAMQQADDWALRSQGTPLQAQVQMGWAEREKELAHQHSINDPGHSHSYVEAPIALHGHPVVEAKHQHGLGASVNASLQSALQDKQGSLLDQMVDSGVIASKPMPKAAAYKEAKIVSPNAAMIARDGRSSAIPGPTLAEAKTTVKRALPSLAAFSVVAPQGSQASPAMLKAFSELSHEQDEATRTSRHLAGPFRA